MIGDDVQDEYSYPLHMSGQVSTLPADDDAEDIIRRLHQAVEDVTGKPVEQPAKRRIGFLP